MAPDFKDTKTDADFSDFLATIVAQPKYGYGPIIALRGSSGKISRFVKLDPSNDLRTRPDNSGLGSMPSELADE